MVRYRHSSRAIYLSEGLIALKIGIRRSRAHSANNQLIQCISYTLLKISQKVGDFTVKQSPAGAFGMGLGHRFSITDPFPFIDKAKQSVDVSPEFPKASRSLVSEKSDKGGME